MLQSEINFNSPPLKSSALKIGSLIHLSMLYKISFGFADAKLFILENLPCLLKRHELQNFADKLNPLNTPQDRTEILFHIIITCLILLGV